MAAPTGVAVAGSNRHTALAKAAVGSAWEYLGMGDDERSENVRETAGICPHCREPTLYGIHGELSLPSSDPGSPSSVEEQYRLLECRTCGRVSLQVQEVLLGGEMLFEPRYLFPADRELSDDVPAALRREFTEAYTCLNARAYTATVVMVRRTLEGICKDNGVNERVLSIGLKKMEASGLMDRTLAEWADGLRVLGNQGAHFTGTQVERQDAIDALDFAEALLDQIYVLRKRFAAFKARRADPGNDGISPS